MKRLIWSFCAVFIFIITCSCFANLIDNDLPEGTETVSFVELGSGKCIPCKQMQPIVDKIEEEYAGKVKVVFHDVWKEDGKKYGQAYNVRMIPTQIFLDKEGNEIFRHEGFFAKEKIEKILAEAGVSK